MTVVEVGKKLESIGFEKAEACWCDAGYMSGDTFIELIETRTGFVRMLCYVDTGVERPWGEYRSFIPVGSESVKHIALEWCKLDRKAMREAA